MVSQQYTEKEMLANKLRKSGKTFKEIGEIMNISSSGARQHFEKYKRKERYNAVIKDFENGVPIEVIAEKSGYLLSTIQLLILKKKEP